jgi:hypothetical protein
MNDRPLGIPLIAGYLLAVALIACVKLFVLFEISWQNLLSFGGNLLLGIGLLMLARWAWVLAVLLALAQTALWGYMSYSDYLMVRLRDDSADWFVWKTSIRQAIIYAMILIYLLDGHVRRAFFRSPPKAEPSPPSA